MVHSLNAHYFHFEGKLLGATRWLMATTSPPDKGMFMGIPVGRGGLNGLLDLFRFSLAFGKQYLLAFKDEELNEGRGSRETPVV